MPLDSSSLDPSIRHRLSGRIPFLWLNESYQPLAQGREFPYEPETARSRFDRYAPLLGEIFPGLKETGGRITSPLSPVPRLRKAMGGVEGALFLKRDDVLPVAGSIKARGGFHEVLALVEHLGRIRGALEPDQDPMALACASRRRFLSEHALSVSSTGNLGLAIGLIGNGFGFRTAVHMSADAKPWKKDRLRRLGIEVIEHEGDYAAAIEAGRTAALQDPLCHFVDDERSESLFSGYAAAAHELVQQLRQAGRTVDDAHPLFVYLPCGVGGAPGGVSFGLKRLLGSNVHCFFAEPVASPCMLVQLAAGFQNPLSVYDIGLDNKTEADGLAVGLASPLAAPVMQSLLSGVFTVSDDSLFRDAVLLENLEQIYIEPSAAAALRGPQWLACSSQGQAYLRRHELLDSMPQSTHVVWSTGGSLVPEPIRLQLRARGMAQQAASLPSEFSSRLD